MLKQKRKKQWVKSCSETMRAPAHEPTTRVASTPLETNAHSRQKQLGQSQDEAPSKRLNKTNSPFLQIKIYTSIQAVSAEALTSLKHLLRSKSSGADILGKIVP